MNEITMYPIHGRRDNTVGNIVLMCGRVIWVLGAILGLYWGYKVGDVYSYFGGRSFDWRTCFIIWIGAFFAGLQFYAISEMIFLLQENASLSYNSDGLKEMAKELKRQETATITQTSKEERLIFSLEGLDQDVPFIPKYLYAAWESYDIARLVYSVNWKGAIYIKGILADVEVTTMFDKTIVQKDLEFVNFSRRGRDELESDPCFCKLPKGIANSIVEVKLIVKGYIYENEYHVPGDGFLKEKPEIKPPVDIKKEELPVAENKETAVENSEKPQESSPQASEVVFCTNCGAKITDPGSIFCHACGAKVER